MVGRWHFRLKWSLFRWQKVVFRGGSAIITPIVESMVRGQVVSKASSFRTGRGFTNIRESGHLWYITILVLYVQNDKMRSLETKTEFQLGHYEFMYEGFDYTTFTFTFFLPTCRFFLCNFLKEPRHRGFVCTQFSPSTDWSVGLLNVFSDLVLWQPCCLSMAWLPYLKLT